ncbi:hypothetical protein BDY21DRAFT_364509 [Lineolata rhizophorae]|uniref:Uncharacterized protein n=1 Tax=Lineolata rhizophorae TaxID=578093 RepID=A0A6A6NZ72_9PEZI|nr:hypothetical protein BDY21DRAFT_364509 [Lineolata rhizophorae]
MAPSCIIFFCGTERSSMQMYGHAGVEPGWLVPTRRQSTPHSICPAFAPWPYWLRFRSFLAMAMAVWVVQVVPEVGDRRYSNMGPQEPGTHLPWSCAGSAFW